jgi:hypothetical protein
VRLWTGAAKAYLPAVGLDGDLRSKWLCTNKSMPSITGLPGAIGLFDEGARATMVGMVGDRV